MDAPIAIVHADQPSLLREVRRLFLEYAASLDFDLCFQRFDEEISGLPAGYEPPDGCLLLAVREGEAAGCVALRRLPDEEGLRICEMKRLYVPPRHRGRGIGRRLALAVVDEARRLAYDVMRLDTLESMTEAVSLYRSMGFRPIPPYRHNPLPDALFLQMSLSGGSPAGGGTPRVSRESP